MTRPEPTTITLPRGRPLLVPLLQNAPEPGQEHHWEGEFVGTRGSTAGATFPIKARIMIAGGLIEGRGRASGLEGKGVDPNFTLTGTLAGSSADFEIWFDGEPLGRAPFACAGMPNADCTAVDGTWTLGCVYPGTCDCDGGGGTYRLWRTE
jgi:hypothetical protein